MDLLGRLDLYYAVRVISAHKVGLVVSVAPLRVLLPSGGIIPATPRPNTPPLGLGDFCKVRWHNPYPINSRSASPLPPSAFVRLLSSLYKYHRECKALLVQDALISQDI
jgi:hypothetical protein